MITFYEVVFCHVLHVRALDFTSRDHVFAFFIPSSSSRMEERRSWIAAAVVAAPGDVVRICAAHDGSVANKFAKFYCWMMIRVVLWT